jgi:hypothetical protein
MRGNELQEGTLPSPSVRLRFSSSMSVAQMMVPATFWTPNPSGITPP